MSTKGFVSIHFSFIFPDRLNADYARRKQDHERREALVRQEKQVNYQKKFEQDMADFASSRPGFLQGDEIYLQLPSME